MHLLGTRPQSLCGDQLKLFLTLDGDVIRDVSFVGQGCCIFQGVGVAAHGKRQGKTKAEAEKIFEQVREMVTTGKINGDMGKLAVFAGVHKYPAG